MPINAKNRLLNLAVEHESLLSSTRNDLHSQKSLNLTDSDPSKLFILIAEPFLDCRQYNECCVCVCDMEIRTKFFKHDLDLFRNSTTHYKFINNYGFF